METTTTVGRYLGEPPLVLYDIPGAGTLETPGWRYFIEQRLYIFDSIIVLFDNRFTETDIAILKNCRDVNPPIPTFIVRSKSDQQIDNLFKEELNRGDIDDEDLSSAERTRRVERCKDELVRLTRANVERNLRQAQLDSTQMVYLVSRDLVEAIARRKEPRKSQKKYTLDEKDLFQDILTRGLSRRLGHTIRPGEEGLAAARRLVKNLVDSFVGSVSAHMSGEHWHLVPEGVHTETTEP